MTGELMEAMQALADVLVEENAALQRFDFAAVAPLYPSKALAVQRITRDKPPIPAAENHAELIALSNHLIDLMTENQKLLARAATIQTRVLEVLIHGCAGRTAKHKYNMKVRRMSFWNERGAKPISC